MADSPEQFRKYLESLQGEQYDALMQERIARLTPEQQVIAQARERDRHERFKLIEKLADPDPEVQQSVFDALRDMDGFECEHGRSYAKHCLACGAIDHGLFPELFDEDGFDINEEEGK